MRHEALYHVGSVSYPPDKDQRLHGRFTALPVAVGRVAVAGEELERTERWNGRPLQALEYPPLANRVVVVLALEGGGRYALLYAVDVFLGVLLGPTAVAVFVADVDDVPVVGYLARPLDTAGLRDDIAAEDDCGGLADRTGRVERPLPPFPLVIQGVGVSAVLVRVEVVHDDEVGAHTPVAGSSGAVARSERHERRPAGGLEVVVLPLPEGGLLAIQQPDGAVELQLLAVGRYQFDGTLLGRTGADDVLLASRER